MNEADVRATYRFLKHQNETEIRLLDPTNTRPARSFFVTSEDEFVKICRRYEGTHNIYVGMNERFPGGTKSTDVTMINAVVIDIDSLHPKDTPSTDAELLAARVVADKVFSLLELRKKNPALAMSGNGWQIWMPLRIRVDEDTRFKVEAVLKDLQRAVIAQFPSVSAKIDNIGDLPRVIKVIGTKSVKMNVAADRPNRISKWYTSPKESNPDWSRVILRMSNSVVLEEPRKEIFATDGVLDEKDLDQYIARMSFKTKVLFSGGWTDYGYASRSEAEMGMIVRLAGDGFTPEEAWNLMPWCGIGKWQESKDAYRRKTVKNAFAWAERVKNEP